MLENPMVIDTLWSHVETDPETVAYCEGCGDEIFEGDDVYEFEDGMVHQNSECCTAYVESMSRCIVAGA